MVSAYPCQQMYPTFAAKGSGTANEKPQRPEPYYRGIARPPVLPHQLSQGSASLKDRASEKEDSPSPSAADSPGSISSSDPESGNEAEWCRDGPGAPAAPSKQRDPLEILLKVFPQLRQTRLEDILHLCKGDVVQAIEQVLKGRDQITAQRARLPKGLRDGGRKGARALARTPYREH
ncbi:hypothetical protein NDU88_007495 [Pleurodeles waltl]|uniref:DMA domain-containing protein n=1 Tax=Pleurodeles waltl TaxID=8319 RepID=A0AAV7VSP4_PLEWA|nr:hypothetical protein NDU88_007495 [Pleurodeles waltl]